MLPRASRPALAGAIALSALSLVTARASAGEDKTITTTQALDGDHTYGTLTIQSGGKLTVPRWDPTAMTGGRLHIKANTIKIFSGGAIDATGSGFQGAAGMAGGAPVANGGGAPGNASGQPGGGGAFFGNGASGLAGGNGCQDLGGSPGGTAFFDMMTPTLGAAGGAANAAGGSLTAGGGGGGVVILEAAVVDIDGTVSANGLGANPANGVAPGAGSGGTIQIIAALIQGSGRLEVKGGSGAHGKGAGAAAPNNGGGGSGGAIILRLPMGAVLPTTMTTDVSGGATGDCMGAGAPSGDIVTTSLPSSCVDVDGDGVESDKCGGMDCDDTDPKVRPGQPEECDGKDNDCNMQTDDGQLCSPPSVCIAGICQDNPDAGGGGAGGGGGGASGPTPDHLEYRGGCSVPEGRSGLAESAAGAAVFAMGALLLAGSRRRRR